MTDVFELAEFLERGLFLLLVLSHQPVRELARAPLMRR